MRSMTAPASLVPDLALKAFGSALAPAGYRARLSILIYHRVLHEPDPLLPFEVDAVRFEAQMERVRSQFNVLPLSEAIERLEKGSLPARAACITFDDGYADNAEVALPILKRLQIPAVFFVATGYLDGGIMFNDRVIEIARYFNGTHLDLSRIGLGTFQFGSIELKRKTIVELLAELKYKPPESRQAILSEIEHIAGTPPASRPMMRTDQVRLLHDSGMEIGGHTVNHPILASIDIASARAEIADNRDRLAEITGSPVRLFAYPNGKPIADYLPEHVELVKKMGFTAAVSTSVGVTTRHTDRFQLPRFTPWDKSIFRFSLRLAANLLNPDAKSI